MATARKTARKTVRRISLDELQPMPQQSLRQMDPKLQRLKVQHDAGEQKPETSGTWADEVAVVAKVNDLAAWKALAAVDHGATMGDREADGTWIVTARIPVAKIDEVRAQPYVVSLKPAQRTRKALKTAVREIRSRAPAVPTSAGTERGRGVVIGVIDFGCAFAHRNFLHADGLTRLLSLWDQTAEGAGPSFGYGVEYTAAQIDAALLRPRPYAALGYGPDHAEAAHGTHVLDIAGGNGRGTGAPGVAPDADLVFVELAGSDIAEAGEAVTESNFGDSVQVLEAVRYVFDQAGARPCVVNLSVAMNGGPHDGSTLVEQGFDRLVRERPNRAIVIAAANSFADGIHAAGAVRAGGHASLGWQVDRRDVTENELEVWYPAGHRLTAELIAPGGRSLGRVPPGESRHFLDGDGKVALFITNRTRDPNNGDNVIDIWNAATVPSGKWLVRLHNDGALDTPYHAWIERDDEGQSAFPLPHDSTHTLGTFACGREPIVVGSYDARSRKRRLSWFSSSGPTRDARHKPELSAPGHGIRAANSRTRAGIAVMSGTSMAAPVVAGSIALIYAAAARRGIDLHSEALRELLVSTARPMGEGWHPRYGFGRIDVGAAIKRLPTRTRTVHVPEMPLLPVPPVPSAFTSDADHRRAI